MTDTIPDSPGEVMTTKKAHYSGLLLHRKCPQAWLYKYEAGLRRPSFDPAPERDLGSWWGALRAAESAERGRAFGTMLGEPRRFKGVDDGPKFDAGTVTTEDVLDAAAVWWAKQTPEVLAAWDKSFGTTLVDRLPEMFKGWLERFEDERRHEHPLGVEVYWERELPRPQSDHEWGGTPEDMPPMILLGFVDEVYWDTEREMVVVRDDKTSKDITRQSAVDDMMDSQLQLYAWGLTTWLAAHGKPQVRSVAYDRARSIGPKPPTLTASGRLAVRNGEPSINGTNLETYREWAKGPDGQGILWGEEDAYFVSGPRKGQPKFGYYTEEPDVVARLSQPAMANIWYSRSRVPLSRHLVTAHLRAAVDSATDIWRTRRRAQATHQGARNLSNACGWCDYQPICQAQMIGGAEGEYDLAQFGLAGPAGTSTLVGIRAL